MLAIQNAILALREGSLEESGSAIFVFESYSQLYSH